MSTWTAHWMSIATMMSLVACGSGKLDGEEGDGSDDNGDGSIDVNDEIRFDGDGPVITGGEIWCAAGADSSGMLWFVEVGYADPQGDADVEMGEFSAYVADSSTEIFSDDRMLVCRDGKCEGSFRDGLYDSSVTCSTADRFDYFATVIDRSGNLSETIQLDWRD